jgi:hypothetical protein
MSLFAAAAAAQVWARPGSPGRLLLGLGQQLCLESRSRVTAGGGTAALAALPGQPQKSLELKVQVHD